jgi:riboflavin synthase
MKKVKLTESTLKRIVERVIFEQEKDDANKELMSLLQKKQKGEDVDKEIKDLLLKNPHLKALQGALTNKGKQELSK